MSNGAGGSAIRRMTLDGEFVIPKVLQLNRLTVGKHVQTVRHAGHGRERGQVHEHVRGHDLVRRPRDGDRPVREQRLADDAERRAGNRRDRPAARKPVRLPRGPDPRRRHRRQRRDGDGRRGADPAPDPQHDAVGGRRGGCDRGPPRELHDGHDAGRTRRRSTARSPASRSCSTRARTRSSSRSPVTSCRCRRLRSRTSSSWLRWRTTTRRGRQRRS